MKLEDYTAECAALKTAILQRNDIILIQANAKGTLSSDQIFFEPKELIIPPLSDVNFLTSYNGGLQYINDMTACFVLNKLNTIKSKLYISGKYWNNEEGLSIILASGKYKLEGDDKPMPYEGRERLFFAIGTTIKNVTKKDVLLQYIAAYPRWANYDFS